MSYTLILDEGEVATLVWASARYEAARVLWTALQKQDAPDTYLLRESDAWAYQDALQNEDTDHKMLPPCIGGTLATKLLNLLGEIV